MVRTKGSKDTIRRKKRDFVAEKKKRDEGECTKLADQKSKGNAAKAAFVGAMAPKPKPVARSPTRVLPRRGGASEKVYDSLLNKGTSAQCGLSSFDKAEFMALISGHEPSSELNHLAKCIVG